MRKDTLISGTYLRKLIRPRKTYGIIHAQTYPSKIRMGKTRPALRRGDRGGAAAERCVLGRAAIAADGGCDARGMGCACAAELGPDDCLGGGVLTAGDEDALVLDLAVVIAGGNAAGRCKGDGRRRGGQGRRRDRR